MKKLPDSWFLIGIVLLLIILRLPTLWDSGGYGDEGIYMAVARAMHSGAQLYVTVWDHKPPMIYWIYYLATFAPNWRIAFIILKVVGTIMAVSILLLFYITGQQLISLNKSTWRIALTVITIIFATSLLEAQTINAELFFIPINLLVLYCLLKWPRYIVIGILAGISLLIKANAFIEVALLIICVSWATLANPRAYLMAMLKAGLGGLVVVGSWLTWVFVHGQWAATWYAVWQYNQDYTAWAWHQAIPISFANQAPRLWLALASLLCVAVVIGWHKHFYLAKTAILAIWLMSTICAATLSDRLYSHYFLQVAAPAVLVVAALLQKIKSLPQFTQKPYSIYAKWAVIITLFLIMLYTFTADIPVTSFRSPLNQYYQQPTSQAVALANHLNQQYGNLGPYYLHGNTIWTMVWTKQMFTNKYLVDYHAGYPNDSTNADINRSKLVVVQLSSGSAKPLRQHLSSTGWRSIEQWDGFQFYQR